MPAPHSTGDDDEGDGDGALVNMLTGRAEKKPWAASKTEASGKG